MTAAPALLGDILASRVPVPTCPAVLAGLMCDTPANRWLDLYDLLEAQVGDEEAVRCWNAAGDLVLAELKGQQR